MGEFNNPKPPPPPEVPEIDDPDSEEEEEEDSEPESPPPEPPTPPELRALRSQCEELERDLQGYNAADDTMSQIANKMVQAVEGMEREIHRLRAQMAADGMPKAAHGYFPPPGSFRAAVLAGAGSVSVAGQAVASTSDGNPSLPRAGRDGANGGNHTPAEEVMRGVEKVAAEIEATIGASSTTSKEEEVKETEEPVPKKDKKEDDSNHDHQPKAN